MYCFCTVVHEDLNTNITLTSVFIYSICLCQMFHLNTTTIYSEICSSIQSKRTFSYSQINIRKNERKRKESKGENMAADTTVGHPLLRVPCDSILLRQVARIFSSPPCFFRVIKKWL